MTVCNRHSSSSLLTTFLKFETSCNNIIIIIVSNKTLELFKLDFFLKKISIWSGFFFLFYFCSCWILSWTFQKILLIIFILSCFILYFKGLKKNNNGFRYLERQKNTQIIFSNKNKIEFWCLNKFVIVCLGFFFTTHFKKKQTKENA